MPKIIENLQQRLKDAAKQLVWEVGYGDMTIRSVAAACGIGVGTVYNYYASKDELLAAWMLDDWNECIAAMEQGAAGEETAEAVVRTVYDRLSDFARDHAPLFQDEAAATSFSKSFRSYHALLRGQVAAPLRRFFSDDFGAEFAAESLLIWTMSGKDFNTIWGQLRKLV